MKAIAEILAQNEVLKGLPEEHLALLSDCARNVVFESGNDLLTPGQEADRFFILRSGTVVLDLPYEHGAIAIQHLKGGDFLGWSWLLPNPKWLFRARALEKVHAVEVDAKCVRKKFESDSAFELRLLKRLLPLSVKRLNATQEQLLEAYKAREE